MSTYALLLLPSANRVYAEAAGAMTRAELGVFGRTVLHDRIEDIRSALIGGVSYLTFDAPELGPPDLAYLSNLSAAYALFEMLDEATLRPVELRPVGRYDDDLITIPKYAGKTNEQFTKLLVNVTVASSGVGPGMFERAVRVFDPLCGRGTTLNQALMYGWDGSGMDIDGKDFEAYRAFLESWTRRKRLKHRTDVVPVRREKKLLGRRLEVGLAPTKEEYQAGDRQQVTMVHADAMRAREFFRPKSFDVLVTDAPYGVQHGSQRPSGELSRRPLALLRGGMAGWVSLLRAGGAVGLSWNTRVASRSDVAAVLTEAGLQVCEGGPYEEFAHRVDQAIDRDLIVARKRA